MFISLHDYSISRNRHFCADLYKTYNCMLSYCRQDGHVYLLLCAMSEKKSCSVTKCTYLFIVSYVNEYNTMSFILLKIAIAALFHSECKYKFLSLRQHSSFSCLWLVEVFYSNEPWNSCLCPHCDVCHTSFRKYCMPGPPSGKTKMKY